MKNLIPIVVILLSLSSCIEVIEEIHINKDKSGSLSYRVESNQIGFLLNKIATFFDSSFENQFKDKVEEIAIKLKQKDGIEHVEFNMNPSNMDYELNCKFSDSKKLNKAVYEIFGYKKTILSPSYLKVSNNSVKKINFSPRLKKYLEEEGIEIPSEYFTEAIYFKSYIYLPEEIKKAKGSQVNIFNEKNRVEQKFKLTDVIENKVNVGVRIKH